MLSQYLLCASYSAGTWGDMGSSSWSCLTFQEKQASHECGEQVKEKSRGCSDHKEGRGSHVLPRPALPPEIQLFPPLQKMCTRGPSQWTEKTPHCWSWTPGRLRNWYGTSRIWGDGCRASYQTPPKPTAHKQPFQPKTDLMSFTSFSHSSGPLSTAMPGCASSSASLPLVLAPSSHSTRLHCAEEGI